MTPDSAPRRELWAFFLLTFAFSWLLWTPLALAAQGIALPPALLAFLESPFNPAAFGPLVAALLLTWRRDGWRGVGALLRRGVSLRFGKVWLLVVLLLPPVIFGGAIGIAILTGATQLDTAVLSDPPVLVIGFFVILLSAGPLQEEFGWRGYALPRLQAGMSPLVAGSLLGVIWWLWHLPLALIPGKFMVNGLSLFALLLVEIVLMSILFTWVYNHTGGSILAALLFHTSMNWSIWVMHPSMQMNGAILGYTILFLAIAVAVVLRTGGLGTPPPPDMAQPRATAARV